MTLRLGDTVPDFNADTTTGPISVHDWIGSDWTFFFSHPADFTPVCTTEMGRTAQLAPRDRAIIPPSLSNVEAAAKFPQGFEKIRPYLRAIDISVT